MSMWKGAVFGLHALVSGTTGLHFEAWKRTFDAVLSSNDHGSMQREFDYDTDFLEYVVGRPRYGAVASFLRSRDIHVPHGHPSDSPSRQTVCGIANAKNELFRTLLSERGVRSIPNAAQFLKDLRANGIRTAVVSSSRNCHDVITAAGLSDAFETVIDGYDLLELGLPPIEEPDALHLAADNLLVLPGECVLAIATPEGARAGRRGNFGLVLGVSRETEPEEMMASGADLVVETFEQISVDRVSEWFAADREQDSWALTYHGFRPEEEMLRESLTTVGNGYIGSRGAFCGADMFTDIHYPGTYVAGLWNTLGTDVHGRTIYNSDFVNIPNWLLVELRIGEGGYCRILGACNVQQYTHTLDMKQAVTRRSFSVRDPRGHLTRIETTRFVSMAEPHLAMLEYRVTPLNYSEPVTLKSTLDGTVINYGVPRYRGLSKRHLEGIGTWEEDGRIDLHTRTSESGIDIYLCARHTLASEDVVMDAEYQCERGSAYISRKMRFHAKQGCTYALRKCVSIFTSRDRDRDREKDVPADEAKRLVDAYGRDHRRFDEALADHVEQWARLWQRADIRIEPDRFSQRVTRLQIYHLLAGASPAGVGQDIGFTARGLHGEAYRGHIFWDELFIAPFYNLHFPAVTREHLLYRYRRLDTARELARREGAAGAMYPWQSGADGGEESQDLHFNPRSGEWDPDLSRNQRHVSLAIAYNVWSYYYSTNDREFMQQYGLEMLLEICRFWADNASWDERDRRYHICGVMGPDEFHEKYPDAEDGGFRDNAYTNILTAWILHKAINTWNRQPRHVRDELCGRIGFDEERELEQWRQVASRLAVVIGDDGVISQFDGYRSLEELDWDYYRRRYENIRRMDRILKAEGDTPDRYQVSKQADTLMLFYLLSPGQVKHTLEIMGYDPGDEKTLATRNYEYYLQRTSHGSTLSYIVHSAVARYVEGHRNDTWHWFIEALKSDIYDTQGGTTREAIHCGVMAGTLSIIVENFAGINLFRDRIVVNPDLPRQWAGLSFRILHCGNLFQFEITPDVLRVRRESDGTEAAQPVKIQVQEQVYEPGPGWVEVPYEQKSARMPI